MFDLKLIPLAMLAFACAEPMPDVPEPRDEPREIPHVPEAAEPAIQAARDRAATAASIEPVGDGEPDRDALDRAALEQVMAQGGQAGPPPEGRVHLLAPTGVIGRFNPESLRAAMEPELESLEACYTTVLREDRHVLGRVVVDWTIVDGRATHVVVQPGAVDDDRLDTCITDWLRGLRIRVGGRAAITQPFLFHHAL